MRKYGVVNGSLFKRDLGVEQGGGKGWEINTYLK